MPAEVRTETQATRPDGMKQEVMHEQEEEMLSEAETLQELPLPEKMRRLAD